MRGFILLFFMLTSLGLEAQNPSSPAQPVAPAPSANPAPSADLGKALGAACWRGELAKATELVEEGAPLEARDKYGRTPLFLACHGYPDVVKMLLAHGAKCDAAENDGDLPIAHACEFGDLASAKLLLAAGTGTSLSHVNQNGRTALILASRGGHDELVELLIAQHVDVNFSGSSDPAINYAVGRNHLSTAKLLLDAGADLRCALSKTKDPKMAVYNLMGLAVRTDDPAMVDLLLDHGLDVNCVDTNGMTVLMNAMQYVRPPMIAHLLEKGADPNLQENDGKTALMISVNYQEEPVPQSLLDHGAKLEIRDKQGRSALIWACYHIYDPAIRFLVEHGADINAADTNGETPLAYAGDRGDMEMVKFLQDKGALRTNVHVIAKPKPQPLLSPAHAWALAVGAIYPQTNGDNPNILGYDFSSPFEEKQKSLKEDWGITDKASLLKEIDDLGKTGHRIDYQENGILLTRLSDLEFNQKILLLDAKDQVKARNTRASYLRWKEKSGLAWDLCRAANLINVGFGAHYINESEAWALLMNNARQVQASFGSWREMSDNFRDGREIWATGLETKFEACSELLCNPEDMNSPWNQLPWKTDLSGN